MVVDLSQLPHSLKYTGTIIFEELQFVPEKKSNDLVRYIKISGSSPCR